MSALPILHTIPTSSLKGAGLSLNSKLAKLGIYNIQDLLLHIPFRYEDRSQLTTINNLQEGTAALIEGIVEAHENIYRRGTAPGLRCLLRCLDNSIVYLDFRHSGFYQRKQLELKTKILCYGAPRYFNDHWCFYHPTYALKDSQASAAASLGTNYLTPIYSSTGGLSQSKWYQLQQQALRYISSLKKIPEKKWVLPVADNQQINNSYIAALCRMDALHAIQYLHKPPAKGEPHLIDKEIQLCKRRLAFEELLAHFLHAQENIRIQKENVKALACQQNNLEQRLLPTLAFKLTQSQQTVIKEISEDLKQTTPMYRLLQGDVSSGKTIVAAMACARVVANDGQAALVAPTELLTQQHYQTFKLWFEPLGVHIALLNAQSNQKQRDTILQQLAERKIDIVIGTHALFGNDIHFNNLALIVIDEQHLFGVKQRASIQKKITATLKPHQLIMSATPIPRTLFMIHYGGLSQSLITQLPANRQSISTSLVKTEKRNLVIERSQAICSQGQQAYWVCPFINQAENIECQAVEDTALELKQKMPNLNIAHLHGKCSAEYRAKTMRNFKNGSINLLVATTIIGVGVDVPNATLMIIDNAERLGLAQLHQLRGRVGRGHQNSHCVLICNTEVDDTLKRLSLLKKYSDGFKIAEEDLLLRGPGEIDGTAQAGLGSFKVAQLQHDNDLIDSIATYGQWLMVSAKDKVKEICQRWPMGNFNLS